MIFLIPRMLEKASREGWRGLKARGWRVVELTQRAADGVPEASL